MCVKKDYTTSLSDKKLGVKWVEPYKVKEVFRDGGAYRLKMYLTEGEYRDLRIVKLYVGQGNILAQS